MIPDNTIYTDGHDVVVTDSTLKVKNTLYTLAGITRHGLSTIEPARVPGFVIVGLGVVAAVLSLVNLLPQDWPVYVKISGAVIKSSTVCLWVGIFLIALGMNINLMLKKKYGVRIATAMGEKDVVISSRKEYVSQIVRALDQALGRKASRIAYLK